MFWLFLILVLNLGISYWNARVCGKAWAEANALGGFGMLVVWSAAIQSAIGFSMVYVCGLAGLAYALNYLTTESINGLFSLWYIAIIVPALGTGLVLTVHSWIVAYQRRDFASIGVAAYNTIAQAHNMYSAVDGVGTAFGKVGDLLKGDNKQAGLVILLVVLAIGGGIMTTYALIRKYAGTMPLPAGAPERRRAAWG